MNAVIHKQIQYDTFSVDIIEKDYKTYLHFQGYKNIDQLDKVVKDTFSRPIKETGREIEREFKQFMEKEGLPSEESQYFEINYFKDEEAFFCARKLIREKHEEFMKKYDDKKYIHKATTDKLNVEKDERGVIVQGKLPQKITTYIIPERNPFLDILLVEMCKNLEELRKEGQ